MSTSSLFMAKKGRFPDLFVRSEGFSDSINATCDKRTLPSFLERQSQKRPTTYGLHHFKVGHIDSTVRSSQGLSLSLNISLSIDVLLLSNFHSRVVAHHSCRDCCSLLISLLHFSILACQSLIVRRHCTNNFCDMISMP